jgi:hypothetical protein
MFLFFTHPRSKGRVEDFRIADLSRIFELHLFASGGPQRTLHMKTPCSWDIQVKKMIILRHCMPQLLADGSIFLSFYYKYCNKTVLCIDFLFLLLHLQSKQGLLGMNNDKQREGTHDKS